MPESSRGRAAMPSNALRHPLVAELGVDDLAVAAGAVAVAGEPVPPRQQHGGERGDAGLGRARDDDAAARIDGAQPGPVVHGRARRGELREDDAGEDLGVLLRDGAPRWRPARSSRLPGTAGSRRSPRRAAPGRERLGDLTAEDQRTHRREGEVDRVHVPSAPSAPVTAVAISARYRAWNGWEMPGPPIALSVSSARMRYE